MKDSKISKNSQYEHYEITLFWWDAEGGDYSKTIKCSIVKRIQSVFTPYS